MVSMQVILKPPHCSEYRSLFVCDKSQSFCLSFYFLPWRLRYPGQQAVLILLFELFHHSRGCVLTGAIWIKRTHSCKHTQYHFPKSDLLYTSASHIRMCCKSLLWACSSHDAPMAPFCASNMSFTQCP